MMKRLFFKLFLAVLPVLVMAACYLYADPFMVLRHYPDLYSAERPHLELNEDYATTETFLNISEREVYDSYIFGSSRSRYYTPDQWALRLTGIQAYHFGVASETLFGVAGKVALLHKNGKAIKNALIIADAELLSKAANSAGHLFRKHPLVSGEGNADFQFTCFKDFFDPQAISSYIKLPAKSPVGKKDPQQVAEEEILKNRDAFYAPRLNMFYRRPATQQYEKQVLFAEQLQLLQNMKKVFEEQHTDYRIVLSPMYDQKKLNPKDMETLCTLFGKDRIYDFSGINDITQDLYNYFEIAHYRPAIAHRIMDSVYTRH